MAGRAKKPSDRARLSRTKCRDKRDFFFPTIPFEARQHLQLDDVANFSVTDSKTADVISQHIALFIGSQITITDATACVGGNVFSFATYFDHVQAVEYDQGRYQMLKHNLRLALGPKHDVRTYCADYLEIMTTLKQDVVFIDPPWGGPNYHAQHKVDLSLSNKSVAEICIMLNPHAKMVVLKLPMNFDVETFKDKVESVGANVTFRKDIRKILLVTVDFRNQANNKNFISTEAEVEQDTHEKGLQEILMDALSISPTQSQAETKSTSKNAVPLPNSNRFSILHLLQGDAKDSSS